MNKAAIQGYLWGVDSSPPTILFAPVLKEIFRRVDSSIFRILKISFLISQKSVITQDSISVEFNCDITKYIFFQLI